MKIGSGPAPSLCYKRNPVLMAPFFHPPLIMMDSVDPSTLIDQISFEKGWKTSSGWRGMKRFLSLADPSCFFCSYYYFTMLSECKSVLWCWPDIIDSAGFYFAPLRGRKHFFFLLVTYFAYPEVVWDLLRKLIKDPNLYNLG